MTAKCIIDSIEAQRSLKTWQYGFLNVETGLREELTIIGIGLASAQSAARDEPAWFETIILTRDCRIFFLHLDCETKKGLYRIAESLGGIIELTLADARLIKKAQEALERYSL